MASRMFVNLPVKDLKKSVDFFYMDPKTIPRAA